MTQVEIPHILIFRVNFFDSILQLRGILKSYTVLELRYGNFLDIKIGGHFHILFTYCI